VNANRVCPGIYEFRVAPSTRSGVATYMYNEHNVICDKLTDGQKPDFAHAHVG